MANFDKKINSTDELIVKTLLETNAINFEAVGKTIASVGPQLVRMDDDGWIRFCGSDFRIYRWPRGPRLEDLQILQDIVKQIPRQM